MRSESLEERRQRLLVLGAIATSVAAVIALRDFSIGRMLTAGLIGGGVMAFLVVALLAWQTATQRTLDLCARLFILTCLVVIVSVVTVTGQTRSAGLPYLLVGPLIAAFLLSWREVVVFSSITALCFLGVGLHEVIRPLPHLYGEHLPTRMIEHMGLFVLVVTILLSMRRRTDEQARLLRQQAARLENARDQALDMASAKSRFLANMSHEIRTPLNAVIGMSDVLLKQELPAESRSTAKIIHRSGEALLSIVNDILDFSRLQSNNLSIDVAPVSPRTVVEDVLDLFAHSAVDRGLTLESTIAEGVPEVTLGDGNRLRQVLINLVGNAIKFTNEGGIDVRVSFAFDRFRYEVDDTGRGVSEVHQRQLFDEFFQAQGPSNPGVKGTGLGLAISRRLVQLMGGTIGVASRLGEGSTFWVELPHHLPDSAVPGPRQLGSVHRFLGLGVPQVGRIAKRAGAQWGESVEELPDPSVVFTRDAAVAKDFAAAKIVLVAPLGTARPDHVHGILHTPVSTTRFLAMVDGLFPAATESDDPIPMMPSLEILVAEDNPVNQMVMRQLLKVLNHSVVFADDGRQALKRVGEGSFDLIFMDVHMPKLDGVEATRGMRAAGVDTPIIALTASVLPEQREACLDAGMNDFLPKPVQLKSLREMIGRHSRPLFNAL